MISQTALIYCNIATSFSLLTLILLVQVLIYPSFSRVPSSDFKNYHNFHGQRISYIVAPLFVFDFLIAGMLILNSSKTLLNINFALSLSAIAFTFLAFVPMHNRLAKTKDIDLINKIIVFNVGRVVIWFLKAVISIGVFYE